MNNRLNLLSKKYNQVIVLAFGPIVLYLILRMIMELVRIITGMPTIFDFDGLSEGATHLQNIGYMINSILWIPTAFSGIILIPAGLITSILIIGFKKRQKT